MAVGATVAAAGPVGEATVVAPVTGTAAVETTTAGVVPLALLVGTFELGPVAQADKKAMESTRLMKTEKTFDGFNFPVFILCSSHLETKPSYIVSVKNFYTSFTIPTNLPLPISKWRIRP